MRESGFTLVETVVAALVLGIGVLAVVGSQQAAERVSSSSSRRLAAVEQAASELDRQRAACTGPLAPALVVARVPVAGEPARRAVRVEAVLWCGAP